MGAFVRMLTHILRHRADGLCQASSHAVLNSNYVLASLRQAISAAHSSEQLRQITPSVDHADDIDDLNRSPVGIRLKFVNDEIRSFDQNPYRGRNVRPAGTKPRVDRKPIDLLADMANNTVCCDRIVHGDHQPDVFSLPLGARRNDNAGHSPVASFIRACAFAMMRSMSKGCDGPLALPASQA